MKKLLKLTFTFLLASSLFACGTNSSSQAESSNEPSTQKSSSENEEKSVEEITIKHSKGETTVKKNPKKIAVFDMGTLDTIQKLGVEAEFALPLSNVPSYIKGYENSINAGGLKEPDIEGLYTFQPDVIFISGRQEDFYDELNKIAPTIYVDLDYKNYMEEFKRNVTNIGKIFDKEDLALEEYNKIEEKIASVKEKTDKSDEKALIIMTSGGELKAFGSKSRFGFIHDVLGYKQADENMYKSEEEITKHGKEVSSEYVSKVNPDILFVIDRDSVVGGNNNAKDTLNNELINTTNAVKNNKVFMLSPEVWYIAGGGLQSVNIMIDEADVLK